MRNISFQTHRLEIYYLLPVCCHPRVQCGHPGSVSLFYFLRGMDCFFSTRCIMDINPSSILTDTYYNCMSELMSELLPCVRVRFTPLLWRSWVTVVCVISYQNLWCGVWFEENGDLTFLLLVAVFTDNISAFLRSLIWTTWNHGIFNLWNSPCSRRLY